MKTLKKGKAWIEGIKVSCSKCGGEFELEASDMVVRQPMTNFYYVECGTQGCMTSLSVSMPEEIQGQRS